MLDNETQNCGLRHDTEKYYYISLSNVGEDGKAQLVLRIARGGAVEYGDGFTADEAYKKFWEMFGRDLAEHAARGKCPHCGSTKGTWFDRTLDEHGNMVNRCSDCGEDVDKSPGVKGGG